MPKATKAVNRARTGRKPRAPFTLNAEAQAFLRAHETHQAAEKAFRAAAGAEEGAGRDTARYDYTPDTVELRNKWHAESKRLSTKGDAIAARTAKKRKLTMADCLLLALASWHSAKARGACGLALLGAAGIDIAIEDGQ